MKRLLLLLIVAISSSHTLSQKICEGFECEGLAKGDILIGLGEIESILFCNNNFPIVPSESGGLSCRYNGTTKLETVSEVVEKTPELNIIKSEMFSIFAPDGLSTTFGVQISLLSDHSKALEVSNALKELGMRPFAIEVGDKGNYGIYVGPFLYRKFAEDKKKLIDETLDFDSIILPFTSIFE